MQQDFLRAAMDAGVSITGHLDWMARPHEFAQSVLDRAKRLAQLTKKSHPGPRLAERQEAVARACGMPNWHALHTATQRIVDEFQNGVSYDVTVDQRCARLLELKSAFVLLAGPQRGLPPHARLKEVLEKFAGRLAEHAGISVQEALALQAQRFGSESWEALCGRVPEDQDDDLYTFQIWKEDGELKGRFMWSALCSSMVDRQDAVFQGYEYQPKSSRKKARARVEAMLAKRPDFLEGWLALGTMRDLDEEPVERAIEAYKTGIEKAEALIPTGFEGRIEWHEIYNRFYLRLLHRLMLAYCAESGNLSTILDLVHKQIRCDPSDTMDMGAWLPTVLLAQRHASEALQALDTVRDSLRKSDFEIKDEAPTVWAIRALVYFALGRPEDAANYGLKALFAIPAIRALTARCAGKPDLWQESLEVSRLVNFDMQALFDKMRLVAMHYELPITYLFALFLRPGVIRAEAQLQRAYLLAKDSRDYEAYRRWEQECDDVAATHSALTR